MWSQRDIQIVSRSPINPVQNEQITQFASKTNISLQSHRQMTVTTPTNGELKNNYFRANNSLKTEVAISSLDLQQYNHIEGTHYHLADDEILLYSPDNTYQGKEIIIHGHKYKVKPVTSFNTSFVYNHSTYKPIFIIAKSQAIAQKLIPHLYFTSPVLTLLELNRLVNNLVKNFLICSTPTLPASRHALSLKICLVHCLVVSYLLVCSLV
ncbi:hypothetical protein ACG92U_00965 [Leuconostoc citreum]